MNADTAKAALVRVTARRIDAEKQAAVITRAQAIGIRLALRSGVSTADVMAVTGLSRARIYQIRDGRR